MSFRHWWPTNWDDYGWDEFEEASTLRDNRKLQEMEATMRRHCRDRLQRLAIDPERLISAVTNLTRYNDASVTLPERARFIQAVTRLTASRSPLLD